MITLTNLEKIYRTKEIETVALENVNLTVNKGEFLSIYVAEHHRATGRSDFRHGRDCRNQHDQYE